MARRPVYLTREGRAKLVAERDALMEQGRARVRERLREAREERSSLPDGEFQAAREEQGRLEARIAEIDGLLARATVVEEATGRAFVAVGSAVRVRQADGSEDRYVIVGDAEADLRRGRISNQSPLGRALFGKRAGQTASVLAPGGSFQVEILAVD